MIDLTGYNKGELSRVVYNDEGFYKMRFDYSLLKDVLNTIYDYSPEQIQDLKESIENEISESIYGILKHS